MTFKGRFALSTSNVKADFGQKCLSTVKIGPKMAVLGEKRGVDVYGFTTPKGTSLHRTASFGVFCVDVHGGVLAVGDF